MNSYWFCTFIFFGVILLSPNSFHTLQLPYNLTNPSPRASNNEEVRIITQSCNYQHFHPNKFWSYMVASEPDLVTLLGDTVYLDARPCHEEKDNCKSMWDILCDVSDCEKATDLTCFNYCWTPTTWYEDPVTQYNLLLNHSDFTLNKNYTGYNNWPVPIVAIWDDHDYCYDNSLENCTWRNLTRDAYVYFIEQIDVTGSFTSDLKYLEEHHESGIYYYYDMNKTIYINNIPQNLSIRFYNLDVRWYRTKDDILGDEQKNWFEQLLFNNSNIDSIDYHIICSGSTYYPTFGVGASFAEPWPNASKDWFVNVTSEANIRNRTIILTGDVHYSAVYRDDYTFEIVTSAMTHGISETQGIYLEATQDMDNYLASDIMTIENIGILNLKYDAFEVLFINDRGQIIGNFSYNYTSDELLWKSNANNASYFKFNWILLLVLFCLIYV